MKGQTLSSRDQMVDIQVVKDWKTELPDIISSFGEEHISTATKQVCSTKPPPITA